MLRIFSSETTFYLIVNTGRCTHWKKKAHRIQLSNSQGCRPPTLPGSWLFWTMGEKHTDPLDLNSLMFPWNGFSEGAQKSSVSVVWIRAPPHQAPSLAGKLFMWTSPQPRTCGCGKTPKNYSIVYAFSEGDPFPVIHAFIHSNITECLLSVTFWRYCDKQDRHDPCHDGIYIRARTWSWILQLMKEPCGCQLGCTLSDGGTQTPSSPGFKPDGTEISE